MEITGHLLTPLAVPSSGFSSGVSLKSPKTIAAPEKRPGWPCVSVLGLWLIFQEAATPSLPSGPLEVSDLPLKAFFL